MKILTQCAEQTPDFPVQLLAPEEEVLFFDIETTGLRKETSQVYLIGCAYLEDGCWMIRQYLAESALDEREIMEAFCDFAGGFHSLIHFNGDGFDIPYLEYKAQYYDLPLSFSSFQSFDIYKMAKPLKKLLGLSNMKQKSIESFLGIHREDVFSGGALIPVFYEFERTGEPEAERLLLLHNFDDVKGMLKILRILSYSAIAEGAFSFQKMEVLQETAVFDFQLELSLPVSFSQRLEAGGVLICGEKNLLQFNVPIVSGSLKLPLPDVENYYYLPEEDRVVHKDVACFVDKSRRRKASKKNCFLKKEGRFLPQKKALFTPAFLKDGERRLTFFELDDSIRKEPLKLREYALDIMAL